MPPKRKRQSGLTGVELAIALDALKKLAQKARQGAHMKAMYPTAEGDPELELDEEAEAESTVLSQIDDLLGALQARADGPQSYSFSGLTLESLQRFRVEKTPGRLKLADDAVDRAALTDNLGNDQLWSATTLLDHLLFLEGLVLRNNEAAMRLWINAFFYRVSTMIPKDLKMGLSIEQGVPAVTVSDKIPHMVSGVIDFTASVMTPEKLDFFLEEPFLRPDNSTLFVSEAKDISVDLKRHIPQAVMEMLACARRVRKEAIRGVVTDGQDWIFLILTLRDGTATYVRSSVINTSGSYAQDTSRKGVSLVSAILAHWILHSHEPLNETNDFFKL